MTIKQATPSLIESFRRWLLEVLGGVDNDIHYSAIEDVGKRCYRKGYEYGKQDGYGEGCKEAKVKFAVLPLPFTEDQLKGRSYGEFITPIGFATQFGECMVPAPGPHGYEQRACYIERSWLDESNDTIMAHVAAGPASDTRYVPAIVTVLR